MSSPLLDAERGGESNISLMVSRCILQNGVGPKERNYLNLSECSSVDSSPVWSLSNENRVNLNLKATELRLGLPGSQSPDREPEFCLRNTGKLDEKPLFPLLPSKDGICSSSQKTVVLGNKRGFPDTMLMLNADLKSPKSGHVISSPRAFGTQPSILEDVHLKILPEEPRATEDSNYNQLSVSDNNSSVPTAKAQVVGWPPLRTFRKNTLATSAKNSVEAEGKHGSGALFIKVSMDGAPFLRKVDLKNYTAYEELSSALEKMFSCFTIGQCTSHGAPDKEIHSESKLRDLRHGSEYVLTYEDKDGDWMLVGDVPWDMFIDSCKKLKIMKSCDAIGLAPKPLEKSKNGN